MWKKLALLITVGSAVAQVYRYWNEAGARAAARRKGATRHEVQRWEDEGGNLPPAAPTPQARKVSRRAGTGRARPAAQAAPTSN